MAEELAATAALPEAEAEAKARAAAEELAPVDVDGHAIGQILPESPEAKARAAKAAKARAALPKVPLGPVTVKAKRLDRAKLAARDYSRLELADRAREEAKLWRAAKLAEEAKADRARWARMGAEAARRSYSAEELAEAAAKAGALRELAEADAMATAAAEIGSTPEELAEELATVRLLAEEAPDVTFRPAPEAGQWSGLRAEELAAVREWTRAGLESEAAKAGRAALAAMGPRASGLVITQVQGDYLTLAKVLRAPDPKRARAKAEELAADHAIAEAKLEEAEAKVSAAIAAKARRPIKEAEAEADRIAPAVAKLAAKLAKAEAAAKAAEEAADRAAEGWIYEPLTVAKLAEAAAKAEELALPDRADVMPSRYRDRGPSAKAPRYLTDNTPWLAFAAIEEAEAKAEADRWETLCAMVRDILAAKAEESKAAKAEHDAKVRAERNARKAAALKAKRRAAKAKS